MLVIIGFLIAAAFGLSRFRGSSFRWDLFLTTFRSLDLRWLTAAILLILLTYVGRALRWQVMIKPICPSPSFYNVLVSTVIGFTAIVLFGRPGELVRPYLIAIKEKVPFSSQVATWVLERIFDLLIVLLIFGFALTQVQSDAANLGPGLQWMIRTGGYIVGGLCALCLIILVMLRRFSDTMRRRMLDGLSFLPAKYYARAEQVVTAFTGGMESTRNPYFISQVLFYTVLEWIVIGACNVCLFKAFPATEHFTVMDNLVFMGFVSFGSAVQIPGVGGGMQVAAVLILTEFFGLSLEVATGLAILIWLTTYVTVVPWGLALGLHEGIGWRNLKKLEAEANQ
ncbi:MAG TPA: lysylphosphatidylglycerol synthase transmembrane domain-containing protein [Bryobacteraceae bacterium]|nr:lysylphosphatidylglycerol synthase transmembrane domain-containing protein [Bryobacteraceae bacterium]